MRVLCVIPVYNEEEHLSGTIQSIEENNFGVDKFLFFESGSKDNSKNILQNSNFEFISLEKNLGIGYVLIKGIEYCLENNYQIITVIHGGNKMDTRDFKPILEPLLSKGFDCTWGSRYLEETSFNMPKFRKQITPILSKYVSSFYNEKVTDATNGFRAYKISYILKILPRFNRKWLYGYAFESFLFGKMLNDKTAKKGEVPVTIKYHPSIKNTKIRPIIDYPQIVFPFFLAKFFK